MTMSDSAWHLDEDLAARYAGGTLAPVLADSVEAHLLSCGHCRGLLVPQVPRPRLDRMWAEITDAVDAPVPGPFERLLRALRVPEHTARLVGASFSLRLPWLAGCTVALLFAVIAAGETNRFGVLTYLAVAPILPVAGVALAFGRSADPSWEIGVAAPYSMIKLMLIRATAVLAATSALTLLVSLYLVGDGWTAAWLLPSLALTSLTLALSGRVKPVYGAAAVGGAWLFAVALMGLRGDGLLMFGPAGQLGYLILTIVSAALLLLRRKELS